MGLYLLGLAHGTLFSFVSSQVEAFMLASGADHNGVKEALDAVANMAWADSRTLRGKYAVLLTSWEVTLLCHIREPL